MGATIAAALGRGTGGAALSAVPPAAAIDAVTGAEVGYSLGSWVLEPE
jgi:hypothetical protein